MGASRIEQIIDEIYDFVESCKPQTFSQSKVIVPKDELYDLLDELKLRTPDEIKRYQKIIANRDSIIADAEEKAKALIEDAKRETDRMINESDIMQEAFARAQEVVKKADEQANQIILEANEDAGQIRTGALSYAEEMLGEVEKVVNHAYESAKNRCESLVETLHGNLEVLANNRNEITAELRGGNASEDEAKDLEGEPSLDDFNFDENTFLEDIDTDEE
ncbi:MAG: ATPase [Lachnospiraceae bacterium]|nr:ATPase [Lachnospiraceae bacterium]